jgi:hypothetical protein
MSEETYGEMLEKKEWRQKRVEIFRRDNFACTSCNVQIKENEIPERIVQDRFYVKVIEWVDLGILGKKEKRSFKTLQVHHEFYVLNKSPWDYPNGSLRTLCDKCHQELHENTTVPVYQETPNGLKKIQVEICDRCNGSGWLVQYKKIEDGICFKCNGERFFYH